MKQSESIVKIAQALAAASPEIGVAKKDATNPYFKNTYATLASVIECCKPALSKNKISILQLAEKDDGGQYIETTLLHESGEWLSSKMYFTQAKQNDPQSQGSAITYARRYALQSFLSIPADDDDGNAANAEPKANKRKETPQEKPFQPAYTQESVNTNKEFTWQGKIDEIKEFSGKRKSGADYFGVAVNLNGDRRAGTFSKTVCEKVKQFKQGDEVVIWIKESEKKPGSFDLCGIESNIQGFLPDENNTF